MDYKKYQSNQKYTYLFVKTVENYIAAINAHTKELAYQMY